MSKAEQLDRNVAEYAKAKTLAEARRLDDEWIALWRTMSNDEKWAWRGGPEALPPEKPHD